MKNVLFIMLSLFVVTACGESGAKKAPNSGNETEATVADANTVYVYYFHGKQRCMTCNTVEKVAKEAIETNFTSNTIVKFLVLPTYERTNEALVEKYEVSWNGLIIAKGDNSVNITEKAFANAVKNPEVLVDLIKQEVGRILN